MASPAARIQIPQPAKRLDDIIETLRPVVTARHDLAAIKTQDRREAVAAIKETVTSELARQKLALNLIEIRTLVARIANELAPESAANPSTANPPAATPDPEQPPADHAGQPRTGGSVVPAPSVDNAHALSILSLATNKPAATTAGGALGASVIEAKQTIQPILMERIDLTAAVQLPRPELLHQIGKIVIDVLGELKIRLNSSEQRDLTIALVDDMLGLGPLEPLLADDTVTDIMVNGPHSIYVEQGGKLKKTSVKFRDDAHVMNIATRIVTRIGRRVDDSTPYVDARLSDGSRVNIIIPPLAIDGPTISIRKFSRRRITLDTMQAQSNISPAMATVLKIASRSRLNILISGGTGSGKTTLLNAMSQLIDPGERIVTIEDAAELQLQQPHVIRLETRPENLEGTGEVTIRDLVKNSLRMRPDRIILGEVRGAEAIDMLQAMNTGHDGSMCTLHANRPREALTRLENMVGMAGINLSPRAVRTQIAEAIDLIVQVSRMRDGMRRITYVTEIVGMEGDVITTQDLFAYEFEGEEADGKLRGSFASSGLRPHFLEKAEYFGLGRALLEAAS